MGGVCVEYRFCNSDRHNASAHCLIATDVDHPLQSILSALIAIMDTSVVAIRGCIC